MKHDLNATDALRLIYPKDGANEEFGREVTIQLTEKCNLACTYCVPANTSILMADGTSKLIKDINIGDKILAFPEKASNGKQRKLQESTVEQIYIHEKTQDEQLYKVTTDIGKKLIITGNHKVLSNNEFKSVAELNIGDELYFTDTIIDYKAIKITDIQLVESKNQLLYNLGTSTKTYIANGLLVHNCYQTCKSSARMSWEIGKRIVDLLYEMWDEDDEHGFINKNTKQIILSFIGGEPMLEVDLMDQICDYFYRTAIKKHHIWAQNFMISISSNGTIYFNEKVQNFLRKWRYHLSYSISIDGMKEMHDACRVFPDGSGSFDLAMAAQTHFNENFYAELGTKATIARDNLPYLSDIVKYYDKQGFTQIHANCVYEEEWNEEDGKLLYEQLKESADYILSLDHELELAFFEENFFHPKAEDDLQNWCWGKGTPILTSVGYRPIEELKVGDLVYTHNGELKPIVNTMHHYDENTCKLKVSGAYDDLTCTKNHELFTTPFDYIGNKYTKHYKDLTKKPVKDIGSKDLLHLFKLNGKVDFDKDLAYIIGRYIGDGWHTKTDRYYICCSFNEAVDLEKHLNDAKIKYNRNTNKTVFEYLISKLKNPLLIEFLSDCGGNASTKRVPSKCLNWNTDSLKYLIKGYIDADGYKNKKGQIKAGTVSYELANDILLILRTIGYNPTCDITYREGKSIIQGREVNIKNRYNISYFEDINRSKYVKNCTTYSLRLSDAEPQEVYNITVQDNHSYIAGGIISSNCGGTNKMLAFDPDGKAFPCIRYMHSSLNDDQPPLSIGNCWDGLYCDEESQKNRELLDKIDRRTQSTDECFYCDIAEGCSWCSGWNYQLSGTPDCRCTRICDMHKARSLANVYFWNKKYIKEGSDKIFKRYLSDEEALKYINQEELNMLNKLEHRSED